MNTIKRIEESAVVDETASAGTAIERKRAPQDMENKAPKMSGASKGAPDTSASPVANRNVEGIREAGVTPRPTEKPIIGGRGS